MTVVTTRRLFLLRGMAGATALACATRSAAAMARAHTPACILTSEQTVGPYYLDLERIRQDITEGKPGVPLRLRVTVVDARRCLPLENAAVDVWHCDAMGVYSGFTANNPNGPPGPPADFAVRPPGPPPEFDPSRPMPPGPPNSGVKHDATTFLRGVQLTSRDGTVEFATIYPGWYAGRAIHIHLRVHVGGHSGKTRYEGGHISYTGQLFFPEDVNGAVAAQEPYSQHHFGRTLEDQDNIFTGQHGSDSIVTVTPRKKGSIEAGLVASAVLGIDPNATSRDMGPGGPAGWIGRAPLL